MKRMAQCSAVGLAACVALMASGARAQAPDAPAAPAAAPAVANETTKVAPLASRDIIEKLKDIRGEIILEEETIRLLKVRMQRAELEAKFTGAEPRPESKKGAAVAARAYRPPVTQTEAPSELLVKAVTTAPFKEAIVTYRGRVYTVRPGDKLGPYEIKDVNGSGVVTSGEGSGRAVLMGR